MRSFFLGLIKTVGGDWVIKMLIVEGLRALIDFVKETDNTWDDRIFVPVFEGIIARLEGEDPAPKMEEARAALNSTSFQNMKA